MKWIIGFEESQSVTKALRALGQEAFSCDLKECTGGHPEWHLQGNLFDVIGENGGGYDVGIFFPPCTDLAVSGARHFAKKQADGRQQKSIELFLRVANLPIHFMAIENPIGIMSKHYRKPDQIIQPWMFGDEFQKTTCLWLKNLPRLYHNKAPNLFDETITHVGKGEMIEFVSAKGQKKTQPKWYADALKLKSDERSTVRSKTFPGIANAMANQWAEHVMARKLQG